MYSYVTLCTLLTTHLLAPVLTSDLYPYTAAHTPPRSLRYVRQCHAIQGRNETFEVAPQSSAAGPLQVKTFTDDVPRSNPHRFAYGHVAVLSNPRDTLSFYEPDDRGSCTSVPVTTQRFLSETAAQHDCIYAANGGFFNTTTGRCLGNMYSDGRLVVNAKGIMNPNFGILKNGTIVVGYLTEEHVLSLDWRNLLQGIVWLVRDRENYVKESMKMECSELQTTGDMQGFVDAISARTAIGHDEEGNVLLLHVEGKTGSPRGINLVEFADLLVTHGFVNAINLDGGGSATVMYNSTIINYPSQHCTEGGGAYRCEHLISSIVCVHPQCNCTHGTCTDHACVCNHGYTGHTCEVLLKCGDNCTGHGSCTEGGCVCDSGWVGSLCHVSCPEGYYGNQCRQSCICTHGKCNHVTGDCTCLAGWSGGSCDTACLSNTWGQDCNNTCIDCSEHGSCDPQTGECMCSIGWQGKICQVYRGTAHFIDGLSTREIGILAVLIGLVALSLISISFNVYYCLKAKSKQHHKSTRASASRGLRSPRLPAADITAQEHVQRQIPIYREIHNIKKNKTNNDAFRMEIRGDNSSAVMTSQTKDVLEMIEHIQEEEDSFSEIDDTALLLKQ